MCHESSILVEDPFIALIMVSAETRLHNNVLGCIGIMSICHHIVLDKEKQNTG